MRWAGHVECMVVMRNVYKILVGRFEVKSQLGTRGSIWGDDIKIDPRKIVFRSVDLVCLVQYQDL
jgi:hypothetical protein